MQDPKKNVGYFGRGMPYNRYGNGKRTLIVFQGLLFDNVPLAGPMEQQFAGLYDFLKKEYTVYIVGRRTGLAPGCSMKDIADDYAALIKEEFDAPIDVVGISTGGSVVQHFAADHPELVRRLVIHSSAYTLSESAKQTQLDVARYAKQKKWFSAYRTMMYTSLPESKNKRFYKPVCFFASVFGKSIFGKPDDPSDLIITIEAEDKHDFKARLSEIKAPTLVVAGENDPFYSATLFRETSEGIPGSKLVLYEGMGHPASGERFRKDLREFLMQE